jgi:hypothetical protein
MTYASDLGLKVGSVIEVLGVGTGCCFNDEDIIELVKDDGTSAPWFKLFGKNLENKPFSLDSHGWVLYKEEDLIMTPFQKAGFTKDTKFRCLCNYGDLRKGVIVTLNKDDGTDCPEFIDGNGNQEYMILPDLAFAELEVYTEISVDDSSLIEEIPLVEISREVKYTVLIKGVPFTFSQDEIDELVSELSEVTTL